MEELHSTDALDEEIRSDARKKAQRILTKTDEEIEKLSAGIEDRLKDSAQKAKIASQERIELYEKNLNASVPLERQRYLAKYIDSCLKDAINAYTASMSEDKKIEVIRLLAEEAKDILKGKKIKVYSVGLDENKISSMLKTVLDADLVELKKVQDKSLEVIKYFNDIPEAYTCRDGVIIVTEDSSIICRFTIAEKILRILDCKRMELSKALFGGSLPE